MECIVWTATIQAATFLFMKTKKKKLNSIVKIRPFVLWAFCPQSINSFLDAILSMRKANFFTNQFFPADPKRSEHITRFNWQQKFMKIVFYVQLIACIHTLIEYIDPPKLQQHEKINLQQSYIIKSVILFRIFIQSTNKNSFSLLRLSSQYFAFLHGVMKCLHLQGEFDYISYFPEFRFTKYSKQYFQGKTCLLATIF